MKLKKAGMILLLGLCYTCFYGNAKALAADVKEPVITVLNPLGAPPGGTFTVIVTGASNNNYFSTGGMVPTVSVRIDPWR